MNQNNGAGVVLVTFFVGYVLSAMSLPEGLDQARPAWIALLVIYWVMAIPHRLGVLVSWCVGLIMDVLLGDVLGQHALALALIAYITYVLHLRIRVFPVWQQCLSIFILVGSYQLIILMIQRMVSVSNWTMWYWLPVVTSALVWPWMMVLLRSLRRRFNIY